MTRYKQGQNVICRVNHAEKDGWAVTIVKDGSQGFIKTANKLKPGDEVIGVFVCVHNGRILLSQLFSAPRATLKDFVGQSTVNWEEQLDDETLDQAYEQQAPKQNKKPTKKHLREVSNDAPEPVVHRRASDVIMPPATLRDIRGLKTFKMADYDLEQLITDLEGGKRTACVKVSDQANQSRSAALFYQGRVVGCMHSSRENPQTSPTEKALSAMLADLENSESEVTVYDLPDDLVLPMSALFLGFPIDKNAKASARENYDHLMTWFEQKSSTACLAIVTRNPMSTNLVLVHEGKLTGVFNVELQKFHRDEELANALLDQFLSASIETSLHSPDWLDGKKPIGYSLSAENLKRLDS